jgi:hypothetical protein
VVYIVTTVVQIQFVVVPAVSLYPVCPYSYTLPSFSEAIDLQMNAASSIRWHAGGTATSTQNGG